MARARVKRRREEKPRDWLPLVAFLGTMAGFLGAYLGAEVLLGTRPHPLHWLVAGVGGLLGYLGGMIRYWRRGDL